MSKINKPKLTTSEQINYMKEKGIKFGYYSEADAWEYLKKNNNYFKLTAYRKNFAKYSDGKKDGQYINLDFAYLVDLFEIDMELRYILVQMALDVEHYAKIRLIKCIEENPREDGYTIVYEYMNFLDEANKEALLNEIKRNKNNAYCGELYKKYDGNYPIWVFIELISFGRMVSFYQFCAERFSDKMMLDDYYRLLTCKEIRNASAHSNCIFNDLKAGSTKYKTNYKVNYALMQIKGITKEIRTRKMSNVRVQQIVTLLYTHKTMIASQDVYDRERKKISEFTNRMLQNIGYYSKNTIVHTTFEFLKLVIDNWYPATYNNIT